MASLYVIEYYYLYSKAGPVWRPMPNEVYLHADTAKQMAQAWVKGSPPDTEFRVEEYVRK